jgi:tetrahydromethanopterin S-methyltransferase subunit F
MRLRFGADDRPAPLSEAFSELREAIATVATAPDVDTLAEVLWAALHGLVMLGRNDRLRPGHDADRTEALLAAFVGRPG